MPKQDYDKYSLLRQENGLPNMMPFIKLPINPTDKYERWNSEFSRLDKLSQKYYGNPFYDFLILLANSKYVSEFDIVDNDLIRIPFPLSKVRQDYETIMETIINQ
ncbi:hypothetical protein [Candidatus Vampirococcus lugosii]|uniref:Uncharacterized protein n=1 Tax=Candidatus Vampirococcus lugosii TaxID=2789015 RepID=A0ABS5QP13_9BACT|nr:hypothetical protein [Candidatus Vampirococcus lugosii]MBS8122119.1 hypothetical protein [Candidatus Vampirococcus lugosii]